MGDGALFQYHNYKILNSFEQWLEENMEKHERLMRA